MNKPRESKDKSLTLRQSITKPEADIVADPAHLAGIIASAMDAIITVNAEQRIVLFNAAAEQMFRCSAGQAIGQLLDNFIPERFRQVHRQHIRAFGRTGVTNRRMGALHTLSGRRADGEEFPIEASISQIENADKKLYTVIVRDITQRQQDEEALRQLTHLIELSYEPILVWELEHGIVSWNRGCEQLYGFSRDEAIGQISHQLLHTVYPIPFEEFRATLEHEAQWVGELIHTTRADRQVIVESRQMLIMPGPNAPQLVLETNRNITERKRTEAELRQYRQHLEELVVARTAQLEQAYREIKHQADALAAANVELTEYDYAISHDLRAPLRAIHNYADFLQEDLGNSLDGEQKSHLDGLIQAVLEATTLVEDVLELSRLGRSSTPNETVQLGLFLQNLVAGLNLPAEAEIELAPEWPTIQTNRALLRQIFQNLIENGLKFNQSASKRINLGWRLIADKTYELWVQDNGIGIDPRYHEQIFRAFQRLHTTRTHPGSGIGLAIVKKAIQKLGGAIRLESQLGQGSTFFIMLPDLSLVELPEPAHDH
ncbi:MAG: PAS domain S-box protein [Anaerolineae bacterium]